MGYFGDGILISPILWRSIVVEGGLVGFGNEQEPVGWMVVPAATAVAAVADE